MDVERAPTTEASVELVPITERMLRRLGGSRWLWSLLWSLLAVLSPGVYGSAIVATGQRLTTADAVQLVTTQAVLGYACFVLLAGTGLLTRQALQAREDVLRLVGAGPRRDLFRGIASVLGPLVLTAAVVAASVAGGWARYGPIPPLASLPLLFLYTLPMLTFAWVYLSILADIDRLGRLPLQLVGFPHDRTLGLGDVGTIAASGFGVLLVAVVPIMLVAIDEPITLAISLVVVAVTVAVFVLSMWRLHRQMAAAKERYVAETARLYGEAYAPLRERGDLATLEAQSGALRAAQALDDRAQGLPTWPIDEEMRRFIAVVVTGVVTGLLVRGFFAGIGL